MRKVIPLLWLMLSLPLLAQDPLGTKAATVNVGSIPVVTIMQGKSGTVPITFRVAGGYHINSNQPKSEYLIPTTLRVDATTDIAIGRITYPEGHDMSFAFSPDEKLNVYTGDIEIDVTVHPLHTVVAGKYAIRGSLKYQACDNAQCYPPKQLPVTFEVKVSKTPPRPMKNPAQSPHAHR